MQSRSMRIAFIVHDYHKKGGQSRYVSELADRFAHEHEVHVFANRVEGDRNPRIVFHHVPALRFYSLASVLTFILPATLRRLSQFDIIHAQGLSGLRQNVITAHMCQPAWYEAQIKHGGALTLKQKIFRTLVEPLESFVFQKHTTRAVIAVSQLLKNDLENHYKRTDNVTVVYHGVDCETFHPRNRNLHRAELRKELGLTEDRFVALYVGEMQKAGPAAIEAISKTRDMSLICVSSSNVERYEALAKQLNCADRVIFRQNTPTIQKYYAAADVFVFPTFYDTFGMVVSEAMASGLPVIASSAAGAAEWIEHGLSGVIIGSTWDSTALGEWIDRLKSDAILREQIGRGGRAAIEHYTWDKTAAETMAVYQSVVDSTVKK